MSRLRLLCALAALLLAACDGPAEFSAPLGLPGAAPFDKRLIGQWYALEEGEDGVAILAIEAGPDEGHLEGTFGLANVNAGSGRMVGFGWVRRTAYATVIDGRTYYNTRFVDGGVISKRPGQALDSEGEGYFAASEHGYWIVRAEIGPDEVLTLEVLTENAPKAAGHAAREVDCGDDCELKVFDLTPDEIAELIRTVPADDLFRIRLPFARFGRPPPTSAE